MSVDLSRIDIRALPAERQLLDLDRADCEESMYLFLQRAWPYMDPAQYVDGWHLQAICEHLQAVVDGDIRRLLINLPPRHSKSLQVGVALPAWCWAQEESSPTAGPGVPFLFASHKDHLSLRDSVKCRRLIESPWYQARWGNRFKLTTDQNTKARFSNDKGGERLITSIDAGVTGEGGNCFVAGTLVATPSGQVPIELLRPGDLINSFDVSLEMVVTSRVLACSKRKARDFCSIREISGHSIVCTADHKIYSPGRGFICAGEMGPQDRVLVAGAATFESSRIAEVIRNREAEDWVYDIQVEVHGCFFAENLLVHNCIVIDDPNTANEVASEASLQNVIEWWTTAMPTRANDPLTCAWIVIQQRLAQNDLSGHILEKEADGWVHLCLPGRYEAARSYPTIIGWKDPRTIESEPLWPERFNEEALKRLERTMGPYIFAGQIQQRPEPKGGGIIKRDWWKLWEGENYPAMDYIIAWLDTAYTEEDMNDPSGMIVWGVYSGVGETRSSRIVGPDGELIRRNRHDAEFAPRVMCMYAWTERLELHDLVVRTAQVCIKMKVDTLFIENKASGHSVAQEIQRLYTREKFGVQLEDPKKSDKTARLYSIQHLFAEGIVYAPDREWMEPVISQVGMHPKGKHDEYVDCTSGALRKLRDIGLLMRQPEREAEIEQDKEYKGHEAPLYSV